MWSKYQQAIFDFGTNEDGNGCIEATAGSGKSTTGVELVQRMPRLLQGRFCSFGKKIVTELDGRLKANGLHNVIAQTYNSFGWQLILKGTNLRPKLELRKTDQLFYKRINPNTKEELDYYYRAKNIITRLVSLFKSLAIFTVREAEDRLDAIVERYSFELPKTDRFRADLMGTFALCLSTHNIMDFDDQKYMPLYLGLTIPQSDFLVVDEFQDTCPLESKLMLASCVNGRKITFGDRYQSIYSFKGTTPDAMQEYIDEYSAKVLPLSICYRCPQVAIRAAQKIVPQIEAAPDAVEGVEDTISKSEYLATVGINDLVIARVTQDLVKSVTLLIGMGKPAFVEGRDFGDLLSYLIDKITGGNDFTPLDYFHKALQSYFSTQYDEYVKYGKDSLAMQLETKFETLDAIIPTCYGTNVKSLKQRIGEIFTDNGTGIKHMTIHKSKGLEGEKGANVYILRPDKIPHARAKQAWMIEEEKRLKYVAITRTKYGLFWVLKDRDEK